jgi:hypothetical protein
MSTLAEPVAVRFDDDSFVVELDDGRTIGTPLAWFPRLQRATRKQREDFELSAAGIHWPQLDEDISVAGLLVGARDRTRRRAHAA